MEDKSLGKKILIWILYGIIMSVIFYISYTVRGQIAFIFNHVYSTISQGIGIKWVFTDKIKYIVSGLIFYFLTGFLSGLIVNRLCGNKESIKQDLILTPLLIIVVSSLLFFFMIFSGEQLASIAIFIVSLIFSLPSLLILIKKIRKIRSL
jgi:hypothetical protein